MNERAVHISNHLLSSGDYPGEEWLLSTTLQCGGVEGPQCGGHSRRSQAGGLLAQSVPLPPAFNMVIHMLNTYHRQGTGCSTVTSDTASALGIYVPMSTCMVFSGPRGLP